MHGEIRLERIYARVVCVCERERRSMIATAAGAGIVLQRDVTISEKQNARQFTAHVAINVALANSKSRLCAAIDPQHGARADRPSQDLYIASSASSRPRPQRLQQQQHLSAYTARPYPYTVYTRKLCNLGPLSISYNRTACRLHSL